MTGSTTEPSDWAGTTKKNTLRLGLWTTAWVTTMAIATFGPLFVWESDRTLNLIAILINLAMGFGMILAHKRYLHGLDEMQRKVQLDAMGLALGVGVVVGLAYSQLDTTNIITGDAEISVLVVIIALTFMVATVVGMRRYR